MTNARIVAVVAAVSFVIVLVYIGTKREQSALTLPTPPLTTSSTRKPQPVKMSLLPDSIRIPQSESVPFRFSVPQDASKAMLNGEFTAEPRPGATLRMTISAINDTGSSNVYDSGTTSADAFRIALKPGDYLLVFENNAAADITNSFGPNEWYRQAQTKTMLTYKRPQ